MKLSEVLVEILQFGCSVKLSEVLVEICSLVVQLAQLGMEQLFLTKGLPLH